MPGRGWIHRSACLERGACSVLGIRQSQPSNSHSGKAHQQAGSSRRLAAEDVPQRSHATCCTSCEPLCGSARPSLPPNFHQPPTHSKWAASNDTHDEWFLSICLGIARLAVFHYGGPPGCRSQFTLELQAKQPSSHSDKIFICIPPSPIVGVEPPHHLQPASSIYICRNHFANDTVK